MNQLMSHLIYFSLLCVLINSLERKNKLLGTRYMPQSYKNQTMTKPNNLNYLYDEVYYYSYTR